jgi:hypothetical protein
VFIAAAVAGTGDLHPSTSPLIWPQASPSMIVALCLLAAPGLIPSRGTDSPEPPPEHSGRAPEAVSEGIPAG